MIRSSIGSSKHAPRWTREAPPWERRNKRRARGTIGVFENMHGEMWFVYVTDNLLILTGEDVEWKEYKFSDPDWGNVDAWLMPPGHLWFEGGNTPERLTGKWPNVCLDPFEHAWLRVVLLSWAVFAKGRGNRS